MLVMIARTAYKKKSVYSSQEKKLGNIQSQLFWENSNETLLSALNFTVGKSSAFCVYVIPFAAVTTDIKNDISKIDLGTKIT